MNHSQRQRKNRTGAPGLTPNDENSSFDPYRSGTSGTVKPQSVGVAFYTAIDRTDFWEEFPSEIRNLPQWVTCRSESVGERLTKVPYSAGTAKKASTTDPSTWASFEAAVTACQADPSLGIGFVFAKDGPFSGIDLDHVRDPISGAIETWAQRIIEQLNSYTEVSQSGTGLHILVRGKLPEGRRRKGMGKDRQAVEMYDSGRYFVMTGRRVEALPTTIEERQLELNSLHEATFGPPSTIEAPDSTEGNAGNPSTQSTDDELIERAKAANNGELFSQLWAGEWETADYQSQSEADAALLSMLRFWAGGDKPRSLALFGKSGLNRKKWEREDYRERTWRRINSGETYTPSISHDFGQSTNSPWGPVIPIERPVTATLDLNQAIPASLPVFRDFIISTAEAIQVPVDAVAVLSLGLTSGAAARSFEIRILPDWHETAPLWVAALAEPGERKSALLRKLTAPLHKWMANERHNLLTPLSGYMEARRANEARLANLRKKLASPTPPTNLVALQQSVQSLIQTLSSTPELVLPELISADFTPEAARRLLVGNGEKLMFIAAETDFQQLTGSRYGNGTQNLNLLLAGKTGDTSYSHRVGKSEPLERPAINIVIFVQPAAVVDVLRDANANGRGLVQRFIFVRAESRVGSRLLNPQPVPTRLEQWWESTLTNILDFPWPGKVILNQGAPAKYSGSPRVLDLDPAAHVIFSQLRQNLEDRQLPDRDLHHIQGFASKLPGEIARIALSLQLLQNPHATMVSGSTMSAACYWAQFLIAHHVAILSEVVERPERRHARRLIASLHRNPDRQISARQCFRRICNTTDMARMEDLSPVLQELISNNYLRRLPTNQGSGRGRPQSDTFEVNLAGLLI